MSLYEKYFLNIDTEDKAYFLGLLAADGTVRTGTYNGKNQYEVSINTATQDADILKTFVSHSGFSLRERTYYDKRVSKQKLYSIVEASCRRKECYEIVVDHFKGDLKPLRYFPQIPYSLVPHFIRGYFDGDGSLSQYKDGSWELAISGNVQMLTRIKEIVGLSNNINKDKTTKRLRLRSISAIETFLNFVYADYSICLGRKREKSLLFASR